MCIEDLMVGDIVKDVDSGNICVIKDINTVDGSVWVKFPDDFVYFRKIDKIDPFPIRISFLLENGFIGSHDTFKLPHDNELCLSKCDEGFWYVFVINNFTNSTYRKIRYIHELQHILKCCFCMLGFKIR